MAYFVKKTKRKNDIYLQIYESFRNPGDKYPRHKCWKTYGYLSQLISDDMPDPVAYLQAEVDRLNAERRAERETDQTKKISDVPAARNLGYLPLKTILEQLRIRESVNQIFQTQQFPDEPFQCLTEMVFALATADEPLSLAISIATLWEHGTYTADQLNFCMECFGSQADTIYALFSQAVNQRYHLNSDTLHAADYFWNFKNDHPETAAQIEGQRLICRLTEVLAELFRLNLSQEFSQDEINEFLQSFRVLPVEKNTLYNLSADRPLLQYLAKQSHLPLQNYRLTTKDLKKILDHSF